MNKRRFFKSIIFFAIFTIFSTVFCYGQPAKPAPSYENKLLNGLRLLVWQDPTAEKVTVKLRIHSGAAFDPKDKMGVMALLGDILFPTEQSRDFFKEDLEGSLDITTTYDYIQITAVGKSSEILSIIETLSNAIVNPQITNDTFKPVQQERLKKVQQMQQNPAYLADQAVVKRLLGDFPYGRTIEGTPESLAKIDFADLLLAKDKFLTADNATITFVGNVKPDYVYRATRQLFGNWGKSDKKIPATFAMPAAPDVTTQNINFNLTDEKSSGQTEFRFATRGVARNDKDYWAMRFLADVLQTRIRNKTNTTLQNNVVVVHQRNLLPSYLLFKLTEPAANPAASESQSSSIQIQTKDGYNVWFKEAISVSEFEQTRAKIIAEIDQKSMVDKILDTETFKLISVADEINRLNSVTLADVQRVADRIAKQPFVSVVLSAQSATKQ